MRAHKKMTTNFKIAPIVLLLICAVAAQAQFPKPALPPTPAPIGKIQPQQTAPFGFDTLGFIQYAAVDAMCAPAQTVALNTGLGITPLAPSPTPTPVPAPPVPVACKTAGGWIQVNDDVIRIPQNTLVVFPNKIITWEEMFENNPTGVANESGLALADSVRLAGTYEAHVQGNVVNGNYIAGLVFISQQSANAFVGYVESVNYADGSLTINGRRVQINDPAMQITDLSGRLWNKGRYSIGQSPDARFSADQNNSTVRSDTGYPMCIPRVAPGKWSVLLPDGVTNSGTPDPYLGGFDDPQCPETNRPRDSAGILKLIYTMNAPGAAPGLDNPFPQDPYTEAPFEVGDFVSVKGTLELDEKGATFISATELVANLGIFTAPGAGPAYVAINVLLQGTGNTSPAPSFPQEAIRRAVVEGVMTDPLRNVDISAIDIDCNGNLVFRMPTWVSNFPIEHGFPLIGKKGRFRFTPNGGTFLPPTQYVGAQVSGAVSGVSNNGIIYNSYQMANSQFVFPENLVSGGLPPQSNFYDMPFLINGTGPWPTAPTVFDSQLMQLNARRAETPIPQPTQTIGQLNPFPSDKTPAIVCTPNSAPGSVANAVAGFTSTGAPISAGMTVTLNSTGSIPVVGPFQWTQIVNVGDPIVTILNPTSPTASFIAPVVAAPLNLTFSLTVGGSNTTTPSTVTISIPVAVPPAGSAPSVFAGSAPTNPIASGQTVTLTASGVDPTGGTLSYSWTQTAGPAVVLAPAANDGSVQTFTAPTVPLGGAPQSLSFTVTAASSTTALPRSSTAVTVVVNPVSDRIVLGGITYVQRKAALIINASDVSPGVVLTATLAGPSGENPTINPATGQPYTAQLGPVIPFAVGVFTLTFTNVPAPAMVTITSSAGGIITSPVTVTR
jgi:hypothetical protein